MSRAVTNHALAGSHATTRMLRIVRLADQLIARHETAMCRDGVPDLVHVQRLAKWIAAAVDLTQEQLAGSVKHEDWSHRTALDAVSAALHSHPVPWGATGDQKQAWLDQLVERAVGLAGIAARLELGARRAAREQTPSHLRSA